jgi:lipopolysaccharide transport system ATP-binding protein
MRDDIAIRVENLGKCYQIGQAKSGDLRQSFAHWWDGLRGRSNGQEKTAAEKEFWALKDINFEIKRGEAVGIIGRNGAGKSTLLKILSRITEPSTGRFEINGRVSSLLEVGTGFHSELSGRENIYLNGTILGMKRREVKAKFDEIVAFSGVEKFIDTPVKHYSSGMKVRLAFSVAAHLEPEILIIDEVLAVGDAEFQKKCLGKMDEVSKNEGRTVLFVSHNMAAINQLCSRAIVLNEGKVINDQEVISAIETYTMVSSNFSKTDLKNRNDRRGSKEFLVTKIELLNSKGQRLDIACTGEDITIRFYFEKEVDWSSGFIRFDAALDKDSMQRVGWFSSEVSKEIVKVKSDFVDLLINKFPYGFGKYYLTYHITKNYSVIDWIDQAFVFDVEDGNYFKNGIVIPKSQTFFYVDHKFLIGGINDVNDKNFFLRSEERN